MAGYLPDTAEASQIALAAPAPSVGESIGRCDNIEDNETTTGGNGLLGHDETSEAFNASFKVLQTRSPGVANTCP